MFKLIPVGFFIAFVVSLYLEPNQLPQAPPIKEDRYWEFPEGVPVKAIEVKWYRPTDHYQHNGSIHNRTYNISANRSEPFGNPNYEFPWKTGGLDDTPTNQVTIDKFCQLTDEPITYSARGGLWQWEYPNGTLFGEHISVTGKTTEVRLMDKQDNKWRFRIFRPFATRKELDPYVENEQLWRWRFANSHNMKVVDETSLVHEIKLSKAGVNAILNRPFKDVTGVVFSESENGYLCYAPTAGDYGQIIPIHYSSAFLHDQSCVKCHDTIGKDASLLQPGRDWYGKVRGSDSVFSFSIFDDKCASRDGFSRPVILRSDLNLAQ